MVSKRSNKKCQKNNQMCVFTVKLLGYPPTYKTTSPGSRVSNPTVVLAWFVMGGSFKGSDEVKVFVNITCASW